MTEESTPEPILATNGERPDRGVRNRLNSKQSTGPQTPRGKGIARGNALVHGLTANPAAGVVESPAEFDELLAAVNDALRPRDVIEAGLAHRTAVALWRLLRAARIDGALSTRAVRRAAPAREIVQEWIERINGFWRVELATYADEDAPSNGTPSGKPGNVVRHRFIRPALGRLDQFVEQEVMTNGYAMSAMIAMLDSLVSDLRSRLWSFSGQSAEQLAWLLGEPASLFPVEDDEAGWFLKREPMRQIHRIVAEAVRRGRGEELSPELVALVDSRRRTMMQQRLVCEVPYDAEEARIDRTVALLPDAATLDRLMRYETHAERSLVRCLETFAKLRGATVETLRASLLRVNPNGSAIAVEGSRQTWKTGEMFSGG